MGILNRIPKGFLDLVGAISQGKSPPAYSDAAAPTIELGELYMGETLAGVEFAVNHTLVNTLGIVSVPAEETWLLRSVCCDQASFATTSMFETWSFSIDLFPRTTDAQLVALPQVCIASLSIATAVNNQGNQAAFYLPVPLVLHGGSRIVAQLEQRDAGAVRNTNLAYLVSALKS